MIRVIKNKLIFALGILAILNPFTMIAQDLQSAIKLTESEQFNAAKTTFDNLLKSKPQSEVYYYYGEYYLKLYFTDTASYDLKEYANLATEKFKKGIEVDPLNPLNFVGLGKVGLLLNDMVNAKSNFDKAIALLPNRKTNKESKITPENQALTYLRIADAHIRTNSRDTLMVFPLLRKVADLELKNPDYYLTLGDAYLFLLNDGSNAILNYKKAQEIDPKSPKAKLRLGQLWVRAKKYNGNKDDKNDKGAIDYYLEAIKTDSTFAPAFRELAELYYMAGQFYNAKKNYKKFLDLSPGNMFAKVRYASFLFLAKDYNESVKIINEILEKEKSYTFLYRVQAYSYYESNTQFDKGLQAIELFFKQTKPEKIIPSDYAYYGKLLQKNNKDSLAIIKFNKALELDAANNTDLYSNLASSYKKLKKNNEAIDAYNKKIAIGKAGIGDYLNLATTYYSIKLYGKADTAAQFVLKSKPDFITGQLWMSRIKASIDSTSKEGLAKPYYEKVIELSLKDSVKNVKELLEGYDYLSYYFLKTDAYCDSKKYYDKILAIDPKNAKATEGLALVKKRKPGLKCD